MKSVGSSSGLYQKIRFLFLLYLKAIGGGVAREKYILTSRKTASLIITDFVAMIFTKINSHILLYYVEVLRYLKMTLIEYAVDALFR